MSSVEPPTVVSALVLRDAERLSAPRRPTTMEEAFARVAAELAAIPEEALVRVHADAPTAAEVVLAHLPAMRSLRPDWVREAPQVDVGSLDRLEDYALALVHTHAAMRVVGARVSAVPALYEEAVRRRDALRATARALAAFGRLDASRFERVGAERGHRRVACQVLSLAALFADVWPEVGPHCPFGVDEVVAARRCGQALFEHHAARVDTNEAAVAAAKLRQRAFTAFFRAYQEVQRVVQFLRFHEGDAARFAPSFHGGRPVGSRTRPRPPPPLTA